MKRIGAGLVCVFAACCVVGVLLPLAAIGAGAAPGSDLQPELRGLLSKALKFSPSELADLEKGKVVAHRLGATAAGEEGAVGAARIKSRKEAFIDRYRNIVQFKRGPGVLAIGLFGDPPSIADLGGSAPRCSGREPPGLPRGPLRYPVAGVRDRQVPERHRLDGLGCRCARRPRCSGRSSPITSGRELASGTGRDHRVPTMKSGPFVPWTNFPRFWRVRSTLTSSCPAWPRT